MYGWTWIDGEDAEAENKWIQISYPDGEEMATIMCRNFETVERDHPEWIAQKETAASEIVAALNFSDANAEYVEQR